MNPSPTTGLVERMQALEFRPRDNGNFDEIVARFADGMVHVETMSDKGCYVGFYWDDGRYCQWWISSKKPLQYRHEDGQDEPPRFTAWGADRRFDMGNPITSASAGIPVDPAAALPQPTLDRETIAQAIWTATYRHDTLLTWSEIRSGTQHHRRALAAADAVLGLLRPLNDNSECHP